jgi:hypothetical protein
MLMYINLKLHHNRSYNTTAVQKNEQELTLWGFLRPSPKHCFIVASNGVRKTSTVNTCDIKLMRLF